MRLAKNEKIFVMRYLAYFLSQGEELNMLDILSIFGKNIASQIEFIEFNIHYFTPEEAVILLLFFKENLQKAKANRNSKELTSDNLYIKYSIMDPKTKQIVLETTKEDALQVFNELKENKIKTTTELIYLGLERYKLYNFSSIFPFRDYIENQIKLHRRKKKKSNNK